MDVKVSELSGAALDWAVAKALGYTVIDGLYAKPSVLLPGMSRWVAVPKYGTNWAQGGPIIERERIRLDPRESEWQAQNYWDDWLKDYFGPTPLIAAMRCFVASKLGDVVSIPDELL